MRRSTFTRTSLSSGSVIRRPSGGAPMVAGASQEDGDFDDIGNRISWIQSFRPPAAEGEHASLNMTATATDADQEGYVWPRNIQPRWDFDEPMTMMTMTATNCASGPAGVRPLTTDTAQLSKMMGFMGSEATAKDDMAFRIWRDPSSPIHVIFNLVGLVVLLFDLTLTPYMLSWDVPMDGLFLYLAYVSLVFWTLDMTLSFFTGFYRDGELVLAMKDIALRYLRTTFPSDFLVVACDWISMILIFVLTPVGDTVDDNSTSGFRLLRFAKLGRLLRIMVVLRVVRYLRIMQQLFERTLSDKVRFAVTLLCLSGALLWFNHIVACTWFAIGRVCATEDGVSWTNRYLDRDKQEHAQEYIVAFHWSLAQVTLGSIDIVATNSSERLFNVVCLITGLLLGSSLISTLSANMVELQMTNKDRTQKMRTLRQYLQENPVPTHVSVAVTQQVTERMRERKRLTEPQVPALEMLSASLFAELRFEIVRPTLIKHSLMYYLYSSHTSWCFCFCKDGIAFNVLSTEDDLFFPSVPAKATYVMQGGNLEYRTESDFLSKYSPWQPCIVGPDAWLAEAALWSEWIHTGKAVATEPSHLIEFTPDSFFASLEAHPDLAKVALEYGKQFHRRIVTAGPPHSDYPSDLGVPCTDWDDMVVTMDTQVQVHISLAAWEVLELKSKVGTRLSRRGSGNHVSAYDALRSEIVEGKSIVVLNSGGTPVRIAAVVVVKLTRDDGCILAQIGKWEDGIASPSCELPGGKTEGAEMTNDALRRLLLTKMKPLAGMAILVSTDKQIIEKTSSQHKLRTKYLRTVCNMRLQHNLVAPTCSAHKPFVAEPSVMSADSDGSDLSEPPSMLNVAIPVAAIGSNLSKLDEEIGHDFATRPVYFFRNEVKGGFYAWLSPREFEMLSGSNDGVLSAWISSLGRPPVTQLDGVEYDL